MEKQFALKQGELLKLLAERSNLSKVDIAKELKINPTTLSKIFKYPKLSPKVRTEAARLFKVPIDYFEGVGVQNVVMPALSEPPPEYEKGATWQDIALQEARLREEIASLKAEVRLNAARLKDKDVEIERMQKMLDALIAAIDAMKGK